MFTGIVEAIGEVKSIEKMGASGRIIIETLLDLEGIEKGYSIAVDGVCLTVTNVDKGFFTADLSMETVRLTTLGGLKRGDRVNLERPLTLSKPLGGHLVTGHIDGKGVIKRKDSKDSLDLEVEVPMELARQIVKKGSVAVDGISLTVVEAGEKSFKAAIIPHTLENTTLLLKKEGSDVNIETDIIAKYVERLFPEYEKKGITEGFLGEHGFLKKG